MKSSTRVIAASLGTVTAVGWLVAGKAITSPNASEPATEVAPEVSASPSAVQYTGESAQTRYGPVQVRITVEGGMMTDIEVIDYPNSDHRDQEINAAALPVLVHEGLAAQSANVNTVSGATYTSQGYRQSLQSALDQAGI